MIWKKRIRKALLMIFISMVLILSVSCSIIVCRTSHRPREIPEMVFVKGMTTEPAYHSTPFMSSFYISRYQITQEQFERVMKSNPSYFNDNPHNPVEQVSWYDAIEFCNRLSILENRKPAYYFAKYGTNPDKWPSGWKEDETFRSEILWNLWTDGYRLPTYFEWRYAMEGGDRSKEFNFSGDNDLDRVAWYAANSNHKTHPVGSKAGNELGIYDMNGNVWEWCWDTYVAGTLCWCCDHPLFSDSHRTILGGCYRSEEERIANSGKFFYIASESSNFIGFRIAKSSF